ncbi:MAG: hypothetical protein H6P95_2698, partial [Candidatus Aminicenantes bacterium]|nr:hypothetical protein [Candidatus Aminicenantes bacterium]
MRPIRRVALASIGLLVSSAFASPAGRDQVAPDTAAPVLSLAADAAELALTKGL